MCRLPSFIAAALIVSAAAAFAQGRRIAAFPYTQNFAFVTGTTTAFPTTNTEGGEFTNDANTAATWPASIASHGLNNNGGAGGGIRLQTTAGIGAAGLVFFGDFNGRCADSIAVDWVKVTNSTAGNRINELRIAASVGAAFTDVPLANIAGGAWPQFDNQVGAQSGTLRLKLPSMLDNAADVRIRIYATPISGSGNTPRVVIDNLVVTTLDRPTIASQPASRAACLGTSTTFSVAVLGDNLTYQWRKNGTNISGATMPAYSIASVAAADTGTYDVLIGCNCSAPIASSSCRLTIDLPPAIDRQPQDVTVCEGAAVSFTVNAHGTALTYQWRHNGVELPGATAPVLSFASAAMSDSGFYDVVLAGACGAPLVSQGAWLRFNRPPTITQQPAGDTVCPGHVAVLTVGAAGAGLTYQWRHNGVPIPGATGPAYTVSSTLASNGDDFDVIVSGTCAPPVMSNEVKVLALAPPVIVRHPADQTTCAGAIVAFSVDATGSELGYQWRHDGIAIAGAHDRTMLIARTTERDSGVYDAVITDRCGRTAVSRGAHLRVNSPPIIVMQPLDRTVKVGANVTFTVVASGIGPLTYQWQRNGVTVTGETSPSITFRNVTAADISEVACVIGNPCTPPMTVSNLAFLYVDNRFALVAPPEGHSVCVGSSATFRVAATGSGLQFQWLKNGTPISGAIRSSYTIDAAAHEDAGLYACSITAPDGQSLVSPAGTLDVMDPPRIITAPSDITVCAGETAPFNVAVTGPDCRFQWRHNGTDIPGATSARMVLTTASPADRGKYDCRITCECGEIMSAPATLALRTPPAIISQPADATARSGERARFEVVAVGDDPTYQWRRNGAAVAGARGPVYEIARASIADAGTYDVVVSGRCGQPVVSSMAGLWIDGPASVSDARRPVAPRLLIIPNPASGHTVLITRSLEESERNGAELVLYDLRGARVLRLDLEMGAFGEGRCAFNAAQLPAGYYSCCIEAQGLHARLGMLTIER